MKKVIVLTTALILVVVVLAAEPENALKEADMLLDMMEYKSAISFYEKAVLEKPDERDIRKRAAYAHLKIKKMREALQLLKQELDLFPENADAYDLLAFILYKENRLEDTHRFLEEHGFSIDMSENNLRMGGLAYFILGMHFKEKKEFKKARQLFQKALDKGYDPVKCYTQVTDIELAQGNIDLAQTVLLKGSRQYGERPEFFFMQGWRYYEKSKLNNYFLLRATDSFEEAVKINPFFKDALFNIACLSYNHKNYRKAAEYFERVQGLNPEDNSIKVFVECVRKKLNRSVDKESVIECPENIDLSKECVENPDREYEHPLINDLSLVIENINFLGLEFIRNGKLHDAIRVFRNGLKISTDSPEMHFNLGMTFSWLNYFKEAEKQALLALRKRGFFGRIPFYRRREILKSEGKSVFERLDIPPSEWTFDVALEKGNHFSDAYDLLGNIYFKKEDFEKSFLAFQKVIDIYPEDAMGHFNLACVHWALEDKDQAEREWKNAIKYEDIAKEREARAKISNDQLSISLLVLRRQVSFQAHKSLGRLYLERNWRDKALEEFEKAIELDPSDPEPYFELGKMYLAKEDVKKAIFYYEKYLYLGGKKESEVQEVLKSLKK